MFYKSWEFRIYPTKEQEIFINKTIGCSRFVYNKLLEKIQISYKETGKFNLQTPASLKEENSFLKEVDSLALANSQMNLKQGLSNFSKNKKKGQGFPKFKSKKGHKQNYTTNNISNSIRIENGKLRLPKLGLIKVAFHRQVKGDIKSVTVKRTKTGKYFVSILTELENKPIYKDSSKEKKVLGIDYSSHDFAVYSSGEIANPPHSYRKYEKKLAKEQKKLSRRSKKKIEGEFSKRREKQRLKVAKIHEKISNIRKDFIEKESTMIANIYDVIVVEDLNLRNISRSLKLGKSTMDNGFGMFRTRLEQKLEQRGKEFIKADKFYPSSQLCSNCGYKNTEVKNLSIREWECPNCHSIHDRDINAAINLELYYTSATDEIYARGDSVRLQTVQPLIVKEGQLSLNRENLKASKTSSHLL